MSTITLVLVGLLVVGIALGIYARFAPRRNVEPAAVATPETPLHASTDWTHEAGDEFSGLSESARCDLVFAVAALSDDRSRQLLEHALSDPAESVALAAAHGLAKSGRSAIVRTYLEGHPGDRADRIAATLSLLAGPTDT